MVFAVFCDRGLFSMHIREFYLEEVRGENLFPSGMIMLQNPWRDKNLTCTRARCSTAVVM